MKTLEELKAIRERMQTKLNLCSPGDDNIRIVVGMATCGIAAGARSVLNAFVDEVNQRKLAHITVTQTGCLGNCSLEPMVEVYMPGSEKVTYAKVTPEMVTKIVAEHIVNNQIVTEYTVGAAE